MQNTTQLFASLTMTPAIMPSCYAEVLVGEQDLTIATHPNQDIFVNVGDQYNYFLPATPNGIAQIHLMTPLPHHYLIRVWCDLLPATLKLHHAAQPA